MIFLLKIVSRGRTITFVGNRAIKQGLILHYLVDLSTFFGNVTRAIAVRNKLVRKNSEKEMLQYNLGLLFSCRYIVSCGILLTKARATKNMPKSHFQRQ